MKITKLHIANFRGFQNQEFSIGTQLTAIAGQNGTQKSTLLGMITQPFTISGENPMIKEKPLCGGQYKSAFNDKFRLSPTFDKPKEHEWTLFFDDGTDFTMESIARHRSDTIRFYRKGKHGRGDGYKQFPTIFLSLKRLLPVAEEKKIQTNTLYLEEEEKEKYRKLHNKILIIPDDIQITDTCAIHSAHKLTLGVNTEIYDWNQNSMGQDNLGKIILALFSFERLQKKYPQKYQGGILAIDELDATMYPASQVELLKVLRKYASKLNLQILFTTHSPILLKALDDLRQETNSEKQINIVYLKKRDQKVHVTNNTSFEDIMSDITVSMLDTPTKRKKKITVYTEDHEAIIFVKAILKRKADCLHFVNISLSASSLLEMSFRKVPAFTFPHSIIILDGDISSEKDKARKLSSVDNVLLLPGSKSPERVIAEYLHNLSDTDPLWSTIGSGFSKQLCFRDITFSEIMNGGDQGRKHAKEWFNSHLSKWGTNATKVLNPLFQNISKEKTQFVENFENLVNRFIHDY